MRIFILIAAAMLVSSLQAQDNSTQEPTNTSVQEEKVPKRVDSLRSNSANLSQQRSEPKKSVYKPNK